MAKVEFIQIRLKQEEKRKLEELANRHSSKSVSEYVRKTLFRESVDVKELEYLIHKLQQLVEGLK